MSFVRIVVILAIVLVPPAAFIALVAVLDWVELDWSFATVSAVLIGYGAWASFLAAIAKFAGGVDALFPINTSRHPGNGSDGQTEARQIANQHTRYTDRIPPATIPSEPLQSGTAPQPAENGGDQNEQVPSLSQIRAILNGRFDDVGLVALCEGNFPFLCDKFGRGMGKDEILNVILDHFRRNPEQIPQLLVAVNAFTEEQQTQENRVSRAEVESLAPLLRSDPGSGIDGYLALRKRIEDSDRREPSLLGRLEDLLRMYVTSDVLVELATEAFGKQEYERSDQYVQMIADPADSRGRLLRDTLEYAQSDCDNGRDRLPLQKEYRTRDALLWIQNEFEGASAAHAAQLLTELAKQQEWDDAEIRRIDRKYLHWLELWPEDRPDEPPAVDHWLTKKHQLAFNPFGPEFAELDPRLKAFRVDTPFGAARGRKPVLIVGAPGSGKTAAMLSLALDCIEPLARPREPGALPIRYTPAETGLRGPWKQAHLAAITRIAAWTVARYVTYHPNSFLRLTQPDRLGVAKLISLGCDSAAGLGSMLRQVGPGWGVSSRLIREVERFHQVVDPERMRDWEYLELLGGGRPEGNSCMYLLVDWPQTVTGSANEETEPSLLSLLDLVVPLAGRRVYLKLFLPQHLGQALADYASYEAVFLTWDSDSLGKIIHARFRAADGESLTALCGLDARGRQLGPDERLVHAANGSPRELVRLGNNLFKIQLQDNPNADWLSAQVIDKVLDRNRHRDGQAKL